MGRRTRSRHPDANLPLSISTVLYKLYILSATDMQAVHCMQLPKAWAGGPSEGHNVWHIGALRHVCWSNSHHQLGTAVRGARSTLLGACGTWMQIPLPSASALDKVVRK